ncbi:MAG: sugar transferase, partial [Mesorhizobium sp.]
MKRAFDVLVSAATLLVLAPVMGVLAVLVRHSSPGPALFVQERVGRFERPFRCYKFRTMAMGAPVAGSHEVAASWVTPLGRR